MHRDYREELSATVERFLADIRRLARSALQQRRALLLSTVEPSRDRPVPPARTATIRPAARPQAAVARVATRQIRKAAKPVVDAEKTRAREAPAPLAPSASLAPSAPRRKPKVAVDVARRRPRAAAPPPGSGQLPAVSPMHAPASSPGAVASEPAAVSGPPAAAATPAIATPATEVPADSSSPRRRGTVKWFDAGKGYGFIRGDDGEDAFVHHSAVSEAGFRAFNQGQVVEYEVRYTHKGLQAIALRMG